MHYTFKSLEIKLKAYFKSNLSRGINILNKEENIRKCVIAWIVNNLNSDSNMQQSTQIQQKLGYKKKKKKIVLIRI